jgi:putative glutamine amidotransferase
VKIAVTSHNLDETARRENSSYERALRGAGLDPVYITPRESSPLAGLRGLMLTGGSDLNPALYGQAVNGSEDVDDDRDRLELDVLARALATDLPVLAICRGVQLLNVAHGGSLIQHLAAGAMHQKRCPGCEMGRHPAAHSVEVAAGTRLAGISGAGAHEVNSRHHQAAERVGDGLIVSARSTDGVIEGLERPGRKFVVGVQWHPEDRYLVSDGDRRLFAAFAAAAGAK